MNKENIMMRLKIDREYSERQVLQSIKMLRGILDKVEEDVANKDIRADNGLQGNEWRLYKELSNLEKLDEFIKQLEEL